MKSFMKAVKNLLKAYYKKNYEMNKSVYTTPRKLVFHNRKALVPHGMGAFFRL